MRRELDRGRGDSKIWPFPVSLEPPFTPFSPERLRAPSKRLAEPPSPKPYTPVSASDMKSLKIKLSADDEYSSGISEQLLLAFSPQFPLSFEMIGRNGRVSLQLVAATMDVENISRQLSSHYPKAQVSQGSDLLRVGPHTRLVARSYRLRESPIFCIRAKHDTETYTALIGILSELGTEQFGMFQALFQPVHSPHRDNILKVTHDPYDPSKGAFVDLPDLPKKARKKLEGPLFAVSFRIAGSDDAMLARMEGGFLSQFESEDNRLIPITRSYPIDAILGRYTRNAGMLLNSQELAAMVHLPNPDNLAAGKLEMATTTAMAPPLADRQLIYLGLNRHQGKETPVGISADWITRHVAIFGSTGYGKTTLIIRIFIQLMEQGYGFAFIDPAGDAAEEILDLVPEHRVEDVIYFDPGDREFPPALNVLESSGQDREMLTAELMICLKRIFHGHSEFGPRMEWILRQAILTLLASEGEKTLRDIPRLLADDSYREDVLKTVSDPDILWFWRSRAPFAPSVIDPILNRLSAFLDRPTIRNIVSQNNLIDFHKILQEGKILICNLSKGILGEEHSSLLGSFILSKLQLATMARAQIAPKDRKLFVIAVDEFQNYARGGSDTSSIRNFLSESRKYATAFISSTQFTSQLDRDVLTAIYGNVGTLVCFRCGMVDAQLLQRELGIFTDEDLLNLQTGQVVVRMGRASSTFNVDIDAASLLTHSNKNQILQLNRERYRGRRDEVEATFLEVVPHGASETEIQYQITIEPDELAFLERVALHPGEAVTAACRALGMGGYRIMRVRRALIDHGLIIEVDTRLGQRGKRAKYAIPTSAGYQAIGQRPPKGRGGPVHKHFVQIISSWAEEKGYGVTVERSLNSGGWVDLHLELNGNTLAIEISISSTPEREIKNITKCLEGGYSRVVVLFLDKVTYETCQGQLSDNFGDGDLKKIELGELNDFRRVL